MSRDLRKKIEDVEKENRIAVSLNNSLQIKVHVLEKRVKAVEAWNKEMYENTQASIKKLEDPDWQGFVNLATKWLEKYPADIFDGSSGDSGPVFIKALRAAIDKLLEPSKCEHDWVKLDNPKVHNHTGTFCSKCKVIYREPPE